MKTLVNQFGVVVLLCMSTGPPALGQAVQLPTVRQFSIGTTVSVPDRGGVHLGGVRQSASGSARRGLSRSLGVAQGASSVQVQATIIDLAELDRAVLAEAAARRGRPPLEERHLQAGFISRHVDRVDPKATPPAERLSVEEIRSQNEHQARQRQAEAIDYQQRAEQALQRGQPGVARIYYQMAARRATGPSQQQLAATK